MPLIDWNFYTKTSGPDMLVQQINVADPLHNTGSLEIDDAGTSGVATCLWTSKNYTLGLYSGELSTSLRHAAGSGYRRHGIYVYANSSMPLVGSVSLYMLELADADAGLSLYKLTNAPFNEGNEVLLTTFMDPMFGNTEQDLLLKISWLGGIFTTRYGGIRFQVSYALDSFDEGEYITLDPYIDEDPFDHTPSSEGFYTRTVSASELVYGLFDTTHAYRIDALG